MTQRVFIASSQVPRIDWGLRDYGLPPLVWGGEEGCEHEWVEDPVPGSKSGPHGPGSVIGAKAAQDAVRRRKPTNTCRRCNAWLGTFGLEPTIEMYEEHSVEVMREVWRVLRPDGTVFYNLADSMASGKGSCYNPGGGPNSWERPAKTAGQYKLHRGNVSDLRNSGLKPLDLCGIPWRVALALQADGWYLRSSIIWAKGREGDEEFMREVGPGSTMPESPAGTRWERHRVKVQAAEVESLEVARDRAVDTALHRYRGDGWETQAIEGRSQAAQWQDCPGCPKCEENDGLVLRRGSWRPTRAYEYVFMLTKGGGQFADQEAVRGMAKYPRDDRKPYAPGQVDTRGDGHDRGGGKRTGRDASGRNPRNVWYINPKGSSEWGLDFANADFIDGSGAPRKLGEDCPIHGQDGETADSLYDELRLCICKISRTSHFATYPEELVERCIKVGTSEKGVCPECGAPWARVVSPMETSAPGYKHHDDALRFGSRLTGIPTKGYVPSQTLGWRATCKCDAGEPIPATVLDPFVGSGTTAIVARKLGRHCIGIDLSEEYVKMTRERLAGIPGWQIGLEV